MQLTWKPWLHCGRTRISSPTANSDKQIAHSSASFPACCSAEYGIFGRDFSTFFFRPLVAGAGDPTPAPPYSRRIQVHRATATRPSTQINAHNKAASMTTKSESTASASFDGVCGGGGPGFRLRRNLAGEVMRESEKGEAVEMDDEREK